MSNRKNQSSDTIVSYRPDSRHIVAPKTYKDHLKRYFAYYSIAATAFLGLLPNTSHADIFVNTEVESERVVNQIKASHFLSQATFGPTWQDVNDLADEIESRGEKRAYNNWISEQFRTPATLMAGELRRLVRNTGRDIRLDLDTDTPGFQAVSAYRDYVVWDRVLTAPDQLRQRMSHALSQILVVGDTEVLRNANGWTGTAVYNDLLLNGAFGNYRSLLEDIVYSPAMGDWLDSAGNERASGSRFPDENFAREFLQLFTVGVFRLNNGGQVLNTSGDPISGPRDTPEELYDNNTIQEFARIFTGLHYQNESGRSQPFRSRFFNMDVPMVMHNSFHSSGRKTLLNGFRTPGGPANGDRDIQLAIDNAFNHSNCPPFISRLLIQRFTTSNPSTDYVRAVSRAFRGLTGRSRGDLRAVIRAILLNPEARNSLDIEREEIGGRWRVRVTSNDRFHGNLREPFIQFTSMLRGFNIRSADPSIAGTFRFGGTTGRIGQFPLDADSVFNFYLPDHQPVGSLQRANLVAPEFEIFTPTRIHNLANTINNILRREGSNTNRRVFRPTANSAGSAEISIFPILNRISNSDSVLNYMNILFCQGTLHNNALNAFREEILNSSHSDSLKARLLINSVLSSPDFAVNN